MDPRHWHIGLVGYGEVGRILAEDLRAQCVAVSAFDTKLARADNAGPLQTHAAAHGVQLAGSHHELAARSDFIVSAVTASQAVPVAEACAPALRPGSFFLDFNSASPGAKQRAASLVNAAGGRYVEGAVMTSVPPYRIKVPLLLGGPDAAALLPLVNALGFAAKVASERLGVASATKMCRSVMIKGLEARDLPRRRLGEASRLLLPARDRAWTAPQRRGARSSPDRARSRPRALERHRHRRAPGLGGRPGRRRPLRRQRHAGLRPQRRLARRSGPHPRGGGSRPPLEPERQDMSFEKTPGWLDWYAGPSKPRFQLPPGSVDAHCHVFGPGDEFPFAPERKYTPCDASKAQLFALRDHLGFARNVIVQATCHGADNRAMVDACLASGGKARGVATVRRSISDGELQALHDAGVRGVRFNFVKRLVDFTPKDELLEIAGRIAKLGWHVVIYFEAVDLPELWDFFTALPTTIVVDHMGRPDVSKPVDGPEFELFVRFMREHPNVWSKVSCPERLSVSGPRALDGEQAAYRDVVPFARRIVETFPDRVLWGTDWPHPNLKDHMPDDGLLVDFIPHIAPTAELQRKLLVDNPMRLYWPEETR